MLNSKVLLALGLIFTNLSASGLEYQLDKITTKGNNILTKETILHYLDLKEKKSYQEKELDNKVVKAYESGLFHKINLKLESKNHLLIEIEEEPIIKEIKFYGNKKIKDQDILSGLKSQAGATFSPKRLKADTEALVKLYQDKGYFGVSVNPKLIEKEKSLTIAFEIQEGKKASLDKIIFFGKGPFSDKELKEVIASQEWTFYRFLLSNYYYDPDRLDLDKELLENFYQNHGYPWAAVTNSKAELSKNHQSFLLKFFIEAGEKKIITKVLIDDQIGLNNKEELNKKLTKIKLNKAFNLNSIKKVEKELSDLLAAKGYAFAKVEHKIEKDGDKAVLVKILLHPSNKFFINKINIKNNTSTREEVIRREMKISEKDGYDLTKIEKSLQRIKNLGFFETVNFQPNQVGNSDKVDLDIIVKEKKTLSAFFKAGYSTAMGGLVGINFAQTNLLGSGRNLATNLTLAKLSKAFDIALTEPYFMGLDTAVGFGLFYEDRLMRQWMNNNNQLVINKHSNSSKGFNITSSYYLTDFLQQSWDYSFKFEKLHYGSNVFISDFLKSDTETHRVSALGHGLFYDQTDNLFAATKGYYVKFGQVLGGLGGDAKFIKNSLGLTSYKALYKDKVILKFSARLANITAWHNHLIRPLDNFYSEDNMIRGFAYNGIGPRDSITNDTLGGKNYFASSLEVKFPVGLPKELGFYGLAFLDAATLTDFDKPQNLVTQAQLLDSKKIRSSYGLSLVWESPLGLMRFDYGIPISKTSFDQIERFNFSLGKSF
jgi:outer membrane protein insertion porin family